MKLNNDVLNSLVSDTTGVVSVASFVGYGYHRWVWLPLLPSDSLLPPLSQAKNALGIAITHKKATIPRTDDTSRSVGGKFRHRPQLAWTHWTREALTPRKMSSSESSLQIPSLQSNVASPDHQRPKPKVLHTLRPGRRIAAWGLGGSVLKRGCTVHGLTVGKTLCPYRPFIVMPWYTCKPIAVLAVPTLRSVCPVGRSSACNGKVCYSCSSPSNTIITNLQNLTTYKTLNPAP